MNLEDYESEENIRLISEDVSEFITKASYQYEPMAISTCMLAQALSIAKTVMSEEDFYSFGKFIFNNLHRIKPM